MKSFPVSRTAAVRYGEGPAKRAGEEVERSIVMMSYRSPFVVSQFKSKPVQNVQGTTTMSPTVTTGRLPKVVKERSYSYAVRREALRMSHHMFIDLHRMLRQAPLLLMMTIASTFEVR